jgi:hypothetical protein
MLKKNINLTFLKKKNMFKNYKNPNIIIPNGFSSG